MITVWLALSLAVITGLFLALLESAHTASGMCYLDLCARSAADSLLADYHRDLWEKYRVFGLEEYADEEIRDELYAYTEVYRDPAANRTWGGLSFTPEDIRVTDTKTLLSEGGGPLREEILSYMRLAWPLSEETTESFRSFTERAAAERTAEDVSEWVGSMTGSAVEMAEAAGRICKEADLLRQNKAVLISAAEYGDRAAFTERASEMREHAENIKALTRACRKASERYDAETADHREDAKDTKALREKLDGLAAYTDRFLRDLTEAEGFSEEAEREEAEEEDADDERLRAIWHSARRAAEELPMPDSFWTGRTMDGEKLGQLKNAGALLSGGLLEVLLPEGVSVSEEIIRVPEAPSLAAGSAGAAESISLMDRLLLSEYVLRHMERYQKDGGEGKLQAEYVLYGLESDRADLSAAVCEGMAIRTGEGLLSLLADAKKRKEAEALSAAVTGGMPGTMEALTFVILVLWAAWQAASDLKVLLAGGKVPAIRSGKEFTVSLSDILSGKISGEDEGTGIDSRDALRLMLIMHMDGERVLRMADVMQYEMGFIQEDFRMRRMVTELEAVVSAREMHVFSLKGTYEMQTTVRRSYCR